MKKLAGLLFAGLLALSGVVMIPHSVHAATLSDLLSGDSITEGTLTFSNFSIGFNNTTGNVTPTVPPYSNVIITGTTIGGEFGLHFDSSTADGFTATGGFFTDALFNLAVDYTVTANDSASRITEMTVAATGNRSGNASLSFEGHIFETNQTLSCFFSSSCGLFVVLQPVRSTISVRTELMASAEAQFGGGNVATFTSADVTFRQRQLSTRPVPEPATGLLVASGIIGLLAWRGKHFSRR